MARKNAVSLAFQAAGEHLASIVFAPDYYQGAWYVGRGKQYRQCANYTTAQAWGRNLRRWSPDQRLDVWIMKAIHDCAGMEVRGYRLTQLSAAEIIANRNARNATTGNV